MANLKLDLINNLNNEKYYAEIEFFRLAAEPNMNYKEKIGVMANQLEKVAILNAQLGLVETYLPEQQAAPQAQPQQPAPVAEAPVAEAPKAEEKPVAKVHQGQSHGEG